MLQKYHALSRLGRARSAMRLENERTEIGKIKNTALTPAMPLFAERVHIAVLPTWHIGTKVAEAP